MAERVFITVAAEASAEFVEKKSRFIGQIAPAESEQDAYAFLELIRQRHKGANHHCYAWQIGADDQFQRSSDAGEPSGTAGRPMLDALKRADLHNVVLVATRYFGGVLLGAGGLTRAYSRSAVLAIAAASLVRKLPARRVALHFDYGLLGRVESYFGQRGWAAAEKLYAEQVCFISAIALDELEPARRELIDLSNGALRWQDLGEDVTLDQPV